MNGAVCPCAVCEERFVGCHAECEVYKAWQDVQKTERDKHRQKRDRDALLVKFKVESVAKLRRRRR